MSKALPPRNEAFFPTIFYKTQFCERQAGLPAGLDLSSKVAIITGANAGLGFESAKQLLALNLSHLILAVRSPEKGEKAAAQLRQHAPNAKIEAFVRTASCMRSTLWFTGGECTREIYISFAQCLLEQGVDQDSCDPLDTLLNHLTGVL